MSALLRSPAIHKVDRFRHEESPIITHTHFRNGSISTPQNLLTLIIRTDAWFATQGLRKFFSLSSQECTSLRNSSLTLEHFTAILEKAYEKWGHEIVSAQASHLAYEEQYSLPHPTSHGTHIHFHSADSLASAVIRQAEALLKKGADNQQKPLFISLDDMIHKDVFLASEATGEFSEIGFSRHFSHDGEEMGFVGRPGHVAIDAQISNVREKLHKMRGNNPHRVPIILIEDNVRRAKTLLWIFKEMEKGGVFNEGDLVGIATCFSVATPEERAKIRHEGKEIPLVVGVNYTNALVDVVTPRDHFFDGFVVKHKDGSFGRLPSFMLSNKEIARNFKISAHAVTEFKSRVIQANIDFCKSVHELTDIILPLKSFTPGPTISEMMDVCPDTPMVNILNRVNNPPHLRLVAR